MATPIQRLPLEERIRLVEDLWDSIGAEQERIPLTPDQRAELDARLDAFDVDGQFGEPGEMVLGQVRKGL